MLRTNQEHLLLSEDMMLGELNFHSTARRSDWMGSAVILGTVMFALTLLMAV
jgi:hypothetical protein